MADYVTELINTFLYVENLCYYYGRQNKALDHLDDDIDELNSCVQGANQRARHLLSK